MKLINEETGEIGRIAKTRTDDEEIEIITDTKVYLYKSISEICEHWEDYEGPEKYWFIENDGDISSIRVDEDSAESLRASEEIGNYFETKEEAELAVRKLKAWKRLKDAGFEFSGWETSTGKAGGVVETKFNLWESLTPEITAALDRCFGGKDEL